MQNQSHKQYIYIYYIYIYIYTHTHSFPVVYMFTCPCLKTTPFYSGKVLEHLLSGSCHLPAILLFLPLPLAAPTTQRPKTRPCEQTANAPPPCSGSAFKKGYFKQKHCRGTQASHRFTLILHITYYCMRDWPWGQYDRINIVEY